MSRPSHRHWCPMVNLFHKNAVAQRQRYSTALTYKPLFSRQQTHPISRTTDVTRKATAMNGVRVVHNVTFSAPATQNNKRTITGVVLSLFRWQKAADRYRKKLNSPENIQYRLECSHEGHFSNAGKKLSAFLTIATHFQKCVRRCNLATM